MSKPISICIAIAPEDPDAEAFRAELARFGDRITIRFVDRKDLVDSITSAEVVVSQALTDAELERAQSIRWLSSWAAGLETVARPPLLARGIEITSASGVHGPNIAEHVLGMMLMFTRHLHTLYRAQLEHRWARPTTGSRAAFADELTGKTLLILGLGRIGEALALRARPFGMRIVGVKRDLSSRHDKDVAVDRLVSLSEIDKVLGEADHICVALPLTQATHHFIDARRLALIQKTAYLYNIARGPVIDEVALCEALERGALRGAGLDVFEEEPLAEASPLWTLPNVIMTPHVAGFTPHYFERAAKLFADNVDRYLGGEPLANRFDSVRGY